MATTRALPIKRLDDGRAMINLACGIRMHQGWNNLDLSPYAGLAHHMRAALVLHRLGVISDERFRNLQNVDPQIIRRDLRRGVPFDDGTFDVVYHSHFLEHLDRRDAPTFLQECRRVLKERGILRVVVPDLQRLITDYIAAVEDLERGDGSAMEEHDRATYGLFDQIVRSELIGTERQRPVVRWLERMIRGGAARAGDGHRWMYDRYSLQELLTGVGFQNVRVESPSTSRIDGWAQFGLDTTTDGSVHKTLSLHMEAAK